MQYPSPSLSCPDSLCVTWPRRQSLRSPRCFAILHQFRSRCHKLGRSITNWIASSQDRHTFCCHKLHHFVTTKAPSLKMTKLHHIVTKLRHKAPSHTSSPHSVANAVTNTSLTASLQYFIYVIVRRHFQCQQLRHFVHFLRQTSNELKNANAAVRRRHQRTPSRK